jgi:hypothetical protein
MSGKQPIFIDANDPEYHSELLRNLNTSRLANRHLPSDKRPCPDIPGIQGINSPLSRRLQTLLDVLADISLREHNGNVSATMASLTDNCGTLETQLYIVFNRELGDEEVHDCRQHLETIFDKLRQVPHERPATDGSPKICVSRQQAQGAAFGDSGVHRAGPDAALRAPGSFLGMWRGSSWPSIPRSTRNNSTIPVYN